MNLLDATVVHSGLEGSIAFGEEDDAGSSGNALLSRGDAVVDEAGVRALDVEHDGGNCVGLANHDASRSNGGQNAKNQQFLHELIPFVFCQHHNGADLPTYYSFLVKKAIGIK